MIRNFYNWVIGLAQTPHALRAPADIAFLERSVFPIPPNVRMLVTPDTICEPLVPLDPLVGARWNQER